MLVVCALFVGCEYRVSGCEGPLCVSAGGAHYYGASTCEQGAGCAERCPSARDVDDDMLREVTLARRLYESCAAVDSPRYPNMTFDPTLDSAAVDHARDMARFDFESEIGSDGLDVYDRVAAVASESFGLDTHLAQLVASGAYDARDAVDFWLSNPAQCALLLSERYSHLGASCRSDAGDRTRWSLVLGGS